MRSEIRRPKRHEKALSAKAAYSKAAQRKLAETKATLAGVNAKIMCSISSGNMEQNGQLERARRAIEVSLAIAEVRLDQLRKSGDDDWETVRIEVESAWEDLSRSIQRLVSTISA
ncbi:MAG: hypothetical protein OEM63_15690 [Gammaproteobacteria bacterium]|nr:hypothetical protein [Gammaproteobacteria bacterium]